MTKKMLNLAMDTVKVGGVTMVGQGVIGTLGGMVPGSGNTVKTIGAGLNLVNVGMLANTGLTLAKSFGSNTKIKYKKKGKADIISKII